MKKLFFSLCLLIASLAHGEEVRISLDMSFDKAVEALQRCGARDATLPQEAPPILYWRLESYGLQVAVRQHYGKVTSVSIWSKSDVNEARPQESKNPRPLQSLTLDTEKHTFVAQPVDAAFENPSFAPENWVVRCELLVVTMPEEKAMAMLPDLRDETKIDAAFARILEAIAHKEAKLIGYPIIYTRSGLRATTETILEKLYPTQFQPPQIPQNFGNQNGGGSTTVTTTTSTTTEPPDSVFNAVPTAFEKRNLGVTLEVEPTVGEGGNFIEYNIQPHHVILEGMDPYDIAKVPGASASIIQPRFINHTESTSLLLRNGQRQLLGVHPFAETGQIELHIFQGSAQNMGATGIKPPKSGPQ